MMYIVIYPELTLPILIDHYQVGLLTTLRVTVRSTTHKDSILILKQHVYCDIRIIFLKLTNFFLLPRKLKSPFPVLLLQKWF